MRDMPARPALPSRKRATKTNKASGRKQATSQKSGSKKAPAKKAPARKAPARKAPARKAPARKAPARKALAKKAAVKKAAVKKAPTKKVAARPAPQARKATPARDALQALALKRTINQALTPQNDSATVQAYFRDIDHPFKAEMEAVRAVVLGVSDQISERIKWNAPSFHYKGVDLGAFNPRATEYAHLILLFPEGAGMDDDSGLLEGNHKDRREAKFHGLDDVKAKKRDLEKLVRNWIALRDR
jgi:hypothetical protein